MQKVCQAEQPLLHPLTRGDHLNKMLSRNLNQPQFKSRFREQEIRSDSSSIYAEQAGIQFAGDSKDLDSQNKHLLNR